MLSLIHPAHPRLLLKPFICFKHPHSHPQNTIILFPASSSHLYPTCNTSIPRNGTSKQHKGAQLRMTIIFILWSIEQHDGGDESNSSFQGQTNLCSIISFNIQGHNIKKQKHKVELISELANNGK